MSLAARLFLAFFLFALPAAAQGAREPLVVESASGRHAFQVERARTPDEQARGLMFRRSMAATHGMLFDWTPPRVATFWMKNTYIPLDMIFIGADGRIRNIAERTVPETTATHSSDGPVAAVLELNGGATARLGIKPGDRVVHPLFGTTP